MAEQLTRARPTPLFAVIQPETLRGRTFAVDKDESTVGRAEGCDVRLENPFVSRVHAVVRRSPDAVIIEDSGSRAGVVVNDVRVTQPTALRPGDRIRLGDVELEFANGADDGQPPSDVTAIYASMSAPQPSPSDQASRRFELERQQAEIIHNVAGNQYNEHALRIAPMRRRARRIMRIGFSLVLLGLTIYVVGAALFAAPILRCLRAPESCSSVNANGWALAGAGGVVMLLGVIVVIISLFMRRFARHEEQRL